MANSAITTHRGPPPAPLQRGIITEIDNVKKFLSETFGKHATPSDVKGQTEDCVKWKVGGGETGLFLVSNFEREWWKVSVGTGLYECKLGNLLFPFTHSLNLARLGANHVLGQTDWIFNIK